MDTIYLTELLVNWILTVGFVKFSTLLFPTTLADMITLPTLRSLSVRLKNKASFTNKELKISVELPVACLKRLLGREIDAIGGSIAAVELSILNVSEEFWSAKIICPPLSSYVSTSTSWIDTAKALWVITTGFSPLTTGNDIVTFPTADNKLYIINMC